MSTKKWLAGLLFVLMAAPPVAPLASAQEPPAAPATAAIEVPTPAETCFIENEYPQIELAIVPIDQVQVARIYFHSALENTFYYVDMVRQGDRFVGILPKPKADAGPVTYYVEAVGSRGGFPTPHVLATVVGKSGDCKDKLAAIVPPPAAGVVVGNGVPLGFSGVAGATGAAGVAAGGGLGAFLTSTTGVLAITGAAAAGVAAAVIANDDNPASPSK